MHIPRAAAAPFLAIDARDHGEAIGIRDLVGRDKTRAHDVARVEILALAGTELALHLLRLLVARRDVVEDRVAENVLARLLARDVAAALADVAAELELEIEQLREGRPLDIRVGADDVEPVRMVEDRPLVPDLRHHGGAPLL